MIAGIKVALFDLDGTIIDTEPYHYQCWNAILLKSGHSMTYKHYLSTFAGVAIDENCRALQGIYHLDTSVTDLRKEKERLMINFIHLSPIKTMTFVRKMIAYLKKNNIRMGLVTSSSREEVEVILSRLKLNPFFDYIVTRDDVIFKKPHPEPYLQAQQLFSYSSEDFIVFEDSDAGIKAAKAAGMKCFAVNKNLSAGSPTYQLADEVFSDFKMMMQSLLNAG